MKVDYEALKAKPMLLVPDAALFTGLSIPHIYRLVQNRQIPHYKQRHTLFFKASELMAWMTANPVKTREQIEAEATTYVVLNPVGTRRRRTTTTTTNS